ncbi:MAG: hypothetical protein M3R41_02415 [Pseudomonadota bacterium]|nr:hypothetical protein [Pseudomonadota bacterium]
MAQTQAQAQAIDIQAELVQRVFAVGTRAGQASAAVLADEIDAIRRIAQSNGLYPAAAVAHALEGALARGERGPLIHGWISILRDAVGCDRHDRAACETFAAACSVRFSG